MKDRYGGLIRIRLSSVSHLGDSEFKSNCRYTCTLSMNFDSSVIEDQGDEIKTFKRVFSVDHCKRLISTLVVLLESNLLAALKRVFA